MCDGSEVAKSYMLAKQQKKKKKSYQNKKSYLTQKVLKVLKNNSSKM